MEFGRARFILSVLIPQSSRQRLRMAGAPWVRSSRIQIDDRIASSEKQLRNAVAMRD
jgi:hypothetical protein